MAKKNVSDASVNDVSVNLLRGFCDPKCVFYRCEDSISFTSSTGKTNIGLCTFGGNARSFGCMNVCLNGKPRYTPLEGNDEDI